MKMHHEEVRVERVGTLRIGVPKKYMKETPQCAARVRLVSEAGPRCTAKTWEKLFADLALDLSWKFCGNAHLRNDDHHNALVKELGLEVTLVDKDPGRYPTSRSKKTKHPLDVRYEGEMNQILAERNARNARMSALKQTMPGADTWAETMKQQQPEDVPLVEALAKLPVMPEPEPKQKLVPKGPYDNLGQYIEVGSKVTFMNGYSPSTLHKITKVEQHNDSWRVWIGELASFHVNGVLVIREGEGYIDSVSYTHRGRTHVELRPGMIVQNRAVTSQRLRIVGIEPGRNSDDPRGESPPLVKCFCFEARAARTFYAKDVKPVEHLIE